MDQQQYDIACAIVDQDCTLTSRLSDGKGNFCVIGGLYTTINPEWAADPRNHTMPSSHIFERVAEAFDIPSIDLLWQANDFNTHGHMSHQIGPRRKRVKAALLAQLTS